MANMTGIRLICRTLTEGNLFLSLTHAMVKYSPNLKYRLEKKNAYDPTYTHRREPYHHDGFNIDVCLDPVGYAQLYAYLQNIGDFYLEYSSNSVMKQFPVEITQMPVCPDDLHEHPAMTSIAFQSLYVGTLPFINFDIITSQDDAETVIAAT